MAEREPQADDDELATSPPERPAGPADPDGWPVPWQPVWGDAVGLRPRLETWVVRAALAGAARLPEFLLEPLLSFLAAAGMRLDRRRTRAAREFVRQALGELPPAEVERLVRSGWRQLLRVTADTERLLLRVPVERLPEHFEVRMSDEARRVFASPRGCILACGHLGNWEAAFAILPTLGSHKVYGVAKPPKNRYLSRALQASRERWNVRVLSRKGAMRTAPEILKAGAAIAMVVDQRTSGRALLVPFFGRLARCERAPAVLLKRHHVPIVVGACRMTVRPLHYRIDIRDVLLPEEWARREVEEIVLRVNQGLERLIRETPEQYVWIHDRYRDTPRTLEAGAGARLERRPPGASAGA